jgi:outer membrane protein assembly factor BamB
VLIPARVAPALLALLDSAGHPRSGWPTELPGATACQQLLPADDGSVRVICTLENPDGNMFDPIGAFAFDVGGRLLAGWPVALEGTDVTGRMVGDDLTLFERLPLGDVIEEGQPSAEGRLVAIAVDGTLRRGAKVPMHQTCCGERWAVGPDGVAYAGMSDLWSASGDPQVGRITALDLIGERAGWPVKFDGIPSGPAFEPGGRAIVTAGSAARSTTRVLVFDRDGKEVSASSVRLPIATVQYPDTGGCSAASPQAPLVAKDGTIFVYSEIDTAVYALDPSLEVMRGWSFEPTAPLERARPGLDSEHEAGYCPPPVTPAVGPDSTLYLPLQARDATVGGSLVAVGPDGKVRSGWPVKLTSPGAEFWSVVVSADGTVYALAIEPDGSSTSSATILAIAPDSTVRWSTTIIEP